jgi:hypothetical protein
VARNEQKGRGGGSSPGRAPLEPEHPLPVRIALFQVALLIGIPVAFLLALKPLLRAYFPELGY